MDDTPASILSAAPRMPLGHWPSPLEPCHRLRAHLGRGPLVWLKRDDCSGLALGGNKTRKLEYLIGQALEDGCTGVITFGALQSNHARQTAAACNRAGLTCDLILAQAVDRADEHYLLSGNLLIDRLMGATVHVVDDPDAAFVEFAGLLERAESQGRRLYTIGPGGSDAVGSLGYVNAGYELAQQCADRGIEPEEVVVATSTAGTAAGLVVGLHLVDLATVLHSVCVYHDAEATGVQLAALISTTSDRLGMPSPTVGWRVTDAALGDGYGVPSQAGQRAIELLAHTEGVLLDPVYTAKAFGYLVDRICSGELDDDRDIIFVHTGGAPGLFGYAPEWRQSEG